jgi:hypothetical protein
MIPIFQHFNIPDHGADFTTNWTENDRIILRATEVYFRLAAPRHFYRTRE